MTQVDITNSIGAIRAALKTRPDGAITGSQVHSLIQTVAPELNIREIVGIPAGPGALSKFIDDYLSGALERIGNHGGDVLYGIFGHQQTAQASQETSNIWRTFVSPGAHLSVAYDCEIKKLRLVEPDAIQGKNLIEIPKASLQEHDELRTEFVESLDPGLAEEIDGAANSDAEFQTWIGVLRTEFPSVYRSWGNFRKQKLLNLFLERANAPEIEEGDREGLVQQIKASHFAAYEAFKELKFQTGPKPSTKWTPQAKFAKSSSELEEARALVHRAVDLMAHDELRSIKLPLGVVLDAIQRRD